MDFDGITTFKNLKTGDFRETLTKFTFSIIAGENEMFADGCFDSSIGTTIPFTTPTGSKQGRLISAVVQDGGKKVLLTIEFE